MRHGAGTELEETGDRQLQRDVRGVGTDAAGGRGRKDHARGRSGEALECRGNPYVSGEGASFCWRGVVFGRDRGASAHRESLPRAVTASLSLRRTWTYSAMTNIRMTTDSTTTDAAAMTGVT
jgi:hypothetical protein